MLPRGLAILPLGRSWRASTCKVTDTSYRTHLRLDKTWSFLFYHIEVKLHFSIALYPMLMFAPSRQQHSEVYTIGIFNYKLYIVNSRRLIPLVQRLSKTLSFTPFQQFAAKVFVNCSAYTVALHENPDFTRDLDKAMRTALSPGPNLDYQNLRAVNSLQDSLNELLSGSSTKVAFIFASMNGLSMLSHLPQLMEFMVTPIPSWTKRSRRHSGKPRK
jgi:hypothetical protein